MADFPPQPVDQVLARDGVASIYTPVALNELLGKVRELQDK